MQPELNEVILLRWVFQHRLPNGIVFLLSKAFYHNLHHVWGAELI